MKVTFYIDYHTNWGEHVALIGSIPALRSAVDSRPIAMTPIGNSTWTATVNIEDYIDDFTYDYVIINDNGDILRSEYGSEPHRFTKKGFIAEVSVLDLWRQMPSDKPMYSAAFTECVFRRGNPVMPSPAESGCMTLQIEAPAVPPGCRLAVSGNIEALGMWNPDRALSMSDGCFPRWSVLFRLDNELDHPLEFKFLLIDSETGRIVGWEARNNRQLSQIALGYNRHVTVDCGEFSSPLPLWRGAGTAIPVFSIRTNDDFGVGDFNSLLKLIDWCEATGQKFLQVLPVNDTTMTDSWADSYPYNANSTFALHPMYLHLQSMGELGEPARRDYYDKVAIELNSLPTVDYEKVTRTKDLYARELYSQVVDSIHHDEDFNRFVSRNSGWLMPYAAFRLLRDRYRTADMSQWGEYATYNAVKVSHLAAENKREITYHYFVQYHLHKQLSHARQYAALKGIALKGDIPIGISRTSVDAWINPRLFNLDCQAGAPPDAFAVMGQNWGFPTYNWDEMKSDNYAWWKARLRKMAEYFEAYRVDHVLGFFRIWQIPMESLHGLLGYFNPALPFTPDELRQNFDFWINPEVQARPFIADYMLAQIFGDYANEVRQNFLLPIEGTDRYTLVTEVDTQRKIANKFTTLPQDDHNTRIAGGLMELIDQVLFIEDPYEKGKYHPRIAAQHTYIYKSLTDYERWTFDRLYNDFFYHRHNDFWRRKAMEKLPPLIDATQMLVCAEDLGMIPSCVPSVMNELQMLSLEVQRMPKTSNEEFANPADYPYRSVCTTSTHDMGGIRQWWEENAAATQRFYNNVLHCEGTAPQFAEPWICDRIISDNLDSPAMLCILPLQDWLSTDGELRRSNPRDEQINDPSNPHNYWRYRMHLTVEQLMDHNEFTSYIREKINASGR